MVTKTGINPVPESRPPKALPKEVPGKTNSTLSTVAVGLGGKAVLRSVHCEQIAWLDRPVAADTFTPL
jgi:hypothetical protein